MEKYLTIKKCSICNSKKKRIVYKISRQNIVECRKCGLMYFDKVVLDVKSLYNEDYFYAKDSNKIANYTDYEYQERVVKKKFKFAYHYILKNLNKGKKLLEVGPGYGYFLKYLPKGLSLFAVEISKKASVETSKSNPGIRVYNSDFIKTNLDDKFDFLVSFDVIEHQVHLKKFLIKISSHLNKNGVFIFTTPDFGTVFNKVFGSTAPTVQPLYHNYYFTKQWLSKNLSKLGFKVIYINTSYFEPMNIGLILLYLSFVFPFLKKIRLSKLVKKIKADSLVIPFFRFGGIECVVQKI